MKRSTYDLLDLVEQFLSACRRRKNIQRNGRPFSPGTVANYANLLLLLSEFNKSTSFLLRITPVNRLTARELNRERNYWKRFHRQFSEFLHRVRGQSDNTVGQNMKLLKSFMNYLKYDKGIPVGDFHKNFHVTSDDIPIVVLQPEQLDKLIYDKTFEQSLPDYLKRTKDIFVLGCTVALRVSDLLSLTRSNLEINGGRTYLAVRSRKTGERTRIALPDFAVRIIQKYKRHKTTLLPRLSVARLNLNIKELAERAGWTHPITKVRLRQGKAVKVLKANGQPPRFCDLVTTHTMRRTAITTMLRFGMPELMVRRISGHKDGSKEFYKYVRFAQSYQDQETDRVFSRLAKRAHATQASLFTGSEMM